jgi:polar amino acid transport system substrate-binding protein
MRMIGKLMRVLVALLAFGLAAGAAAQGDTLAKIKAKGVIVVGVKNDYKPFGFLDPSGKIVGMEIDMAQDLAKRLGVKLELVPVVASNRIEFMNAGKTDLVLATMSDSPARRKVVGMVEPFYYAGGGAALTKKSNGFKKWADLKGKRVCASQGAYYNKRVEQVHGATIVAFPGMAEAYNALKSGDCVAFVQDSTVFSGLRDDPAWVDYETPLVVEDEVGWNLGVPLAELDGPYGKFISSVLTDWHKTGYIVGLEKKWKLPPSPFVAEMQAKYK